MPPVFLELDEVLELHREALERYGGAPGVRDFGRLEAALAVPRSGAGGAYFHADLPEMAAAYLFHLVVNHPFVDGNKRVGALAAFVFLKLNGRTLTAGERAFEELVRRVATGRATKADAAAFFRRHAGA